LFEAALGSSVRVARVETDTGVAQVDSLTVDVDRSIANCWAFHRDLATRAEQEAAVLRGLRPALVVGDIPPLAFEAAYRAGVPSAAVFNFTWDWIYEAYPEQAEAAPELVPTLRDAYCHASVAWRLPLTCGAGPFARAVDVPLIARRSPRDPDDVRRLLRLPPDCALVLVSFGRYGLGAVDWSRLADAGRYRIIVTPGPGSPSSAWPAADPASSIVVIGEAEITRLGLQYEDLVAAVDVVVSKPGYGIIAECAANDTALLYTSRGRFAEYDELVTAMPRFLRCGFIGHEDLFAGRWRASLDRLLALLKPPRPDVSGADVVAGQMLDVFAQTSS
jgi:L-arabinokinase